MPNLIYVVTTSRRGDSGLLEAARGWADRLGVRFVPRGGRSLTALCLEAGVEAALTVTPVRVGLVIPAEGVEYFYHPSMARTRIRNLQQGKGDPMIAAMGLRPGDSVLDCTLGRATDAIVASCVAGEDGRVVGYEADSLIAALTIEGLRRYEIEGAAVQEAMRRVDARQGDCAEVLSTLPADSFDVVYFDPFFDETIENAQAMQPLRRIGVHRPLPTQVFEQARRVARRSVVIKRRRGEATPELPGVCEVVAGGGSSVEYIVLSPL